MSFKSYRKQVDAKVEAAIRRGLSACGAEAESYAKAYETAVDTGTLRNSIAHQPDDKELAEWIGTAVEYGKYIELGHRSFAGLHYLKRALDEHQDRYAKILKASLKAIE